MTDIRNCKRCGKIYSYTGVEVCPNCLANEQQDFSKVRDYLYQNPHSTIPEVSEATGVDIRVITRFLREGRIESTSDKYVY